MGYHSGFMEKVTALFVLGKQCMLLEVCFAMAARKGKLAAWTDFLLCSVISSVMDAFPRGFARATRVGALCHLTDDPLHNIWV
jgi:hypothetical protein